MLIDVVLAAVFGAVCVIGGKFAGSRLYYVGDGFYYHKHTSRDNSPYIHLRCAKRTDQTIRCRGRAVITRDGLHYWISQPHTGHTADALYPLELELRRRIYARLQQGDATPFRYIIRQEGQRYVLLTSNVDLCTSFSFNCDCTYHVTCSGMFPVEVRSRFAGQRIRTAMYAVRSEHLPRIPFSLPVLGRYLSMPQYTAVTETLDKTDNIFAGLLRGWKSGE